MNQRVMVIGADGMVGSAVVRRLHNEPKTSVQSGGRDYVDLMKPESIESAVLAFRPNHVYLCGAYTNVDKAETDPNSFLTNVEGTKVLCALARKLKFHVIFFSSSYVFNGKSPEPYTSYDQPRPICEYGRQKLAAESYVLRAGGLVIRTVGVFGKDMWRHNFVYQVHDRLTLKGEILVPSDQYVNPIWSDDLANHAVRAMNVGGVHHVAGDTVLSKFRFAQLAADKLQLSGNIRAITTREMQQKARRPRMGALSGYEYSLEKGLDVVANDLLKE